MPKAENYESNENFFFDLFQTKYNHYLQRKEILNKKSSNLMAFTGLILTFQGGLGTFLISLLNNLDPLFKLLIILLFIIPLIFYSISIYYSIKSYKITQWTYFPSSNSIIESRKSKVDKYSFIEKIIENYPSILKENDKVLDKKANELINAVNYLELGIFSTVVYILIICVFLLLL